MKIIIDIGHPAHVHYFRNLISVMSQNGHEFCVIARNRDIIKSLLDYYDISYFDRGKGKDSFAGKLTYMLYADLRMYKYAKQFNPDLFLSFVSPYPSQVSKLMGVPYIAITDSEIQDKAHKIFTYPFTDAIITPQNYGNDLGEKHVKIKALMEYFYINHVFYTPQKNIYDLLGIEEDSKYIIVRFISWKAFHDVNQHGISIDLKKKIIKILEKKYHVFITSEDDIGPEFEKYQINIPPERMHDALAYSSLFIGESATMASESALLGVHSIYVNSLPLMCNAKLEEEHKLLKHFRDSDGLIDYVQSFIKNNDSKNNMKNNRDVMISDFINPIHFLSWFIENWPDSKAIMKANPEYQEKFK